MMNKTQLPQVQQENNMIAGHSCTYDGSLSLAKQYYGILSYLYRKNGVTDHGKSEKEYRIRKLYKKDFIIQGGKC